MILQQAPQDGGAGGEGASSNSNKLFFAQDRSITLSHESGNCMEFGADKSITMTHFAKSGTMTWDASGTIRFATNGGDVHIDAGGGSHTLSAQNIRLAGQIAVEGDITQTGALTLTGVIAGGDVTSGGMQVRTA